jgi:hypothetical protein
MTGKESRVFHPGVEVLRLCPQKQNKLVLFLEGPFVIQKKVSATYYMVEVIRAGKKTLILYHLNLLKPYDRYSQTSNLLVSKVSPLIGSTEFPTEEDYSWYPVGQSKVEWDAFRSPDLTISSND